MEIEKSSYDLETEFEGILHIIIETSDEKIGAGTLIAVLAESEVEYEKSKAMWVTKMSTEERKEPTVPGSVVDGKKVTRVISVRGIRRTLAKRVHCSLQESAQLSG
ncbi:MAG: hypothetical protein JSW15_05350 [Deltaproteobacteria bacterium]|nr:MAG: hypothetical protein JSW15_05350 [Deltaproteobacteria bacterium]